MNALKSMKKFARILREDWKKARDENVLLKQAIRVTVALLFGFVFVVSSALYLGAAFPGAQSLKAMYQVFAFGTLIGYVASFWPTRWLDRLLDMERN